MLMLNVLNGNYWGEIISNDQKVNQCLNMWISLYVLQNETFVFNFSYF